MFDQKTLVIVIGSLAAGVSIGGALLGNGHQADPRYNANPAEMRLAQSQIEPQPSQAERDFMDFSMPDLSKPKEGQDVTRHGCVKPDRPQWAHDLPRSETRKALLLTALYDALRFDEIIKTNSCSCETEYPTWDEADWQYQQIAQGASNAEITDLRRQFSRQASSKQFDALNICRLTRGN